MKKTLGTMLAEARARAHWSLRELEKRTGISNALLCQMETGHVAAPSFRNVVKIAAALDISLDRLAKAILKESQ